MNETALIKSYRGTTNAIGPLVPLWLSRRAKQGKEDPARMQERQGIASASRPEGQMVWMHGASVGECVMLLPLIEKFKESRPDMNVLITSGTVTSAQVLSERLPEGVIHQYIPLDRPKYVKRFFDHWQPDLAIWAESEIWPNLIGEAAKRDTPMALINARMSAKSIEGWAKRKASAQSIFGAFNLILAADEKTGNSLSWLLDRDVESSGNLKDAAAPLPSQKGELGRLSRSLKTRPVWCAASTHEGEDQLVIRAHEAVRAAHPKALLILAPRHPERAEDIIKILEQRGMAFARRSLGETPKAKTRVWLFDTIGEMGLPYRLASVTCVCGSLREGLKGHNPLEPARLGSAVITGPNIASFADSYMQMFAHDAARRILSPDILGQDIANLFSTPKDLKTLQDQGKAFASGRDDVLDYVWDKLTPLMPETAK